MFYIIKIALWLLPLNDLRCSGLRARNNIGEDMQRLLDRERNREEQILVFSCCIDKLHIQIRDEPDSKRRTQLRDLLGMLIICRKALE